VVAMTSRERLLAALSGQPTDRVPIWLLFPFHATSYYVDVRNHPTYRPIFEASKGRAVMLDRRNLSVPLFTPDVSQRHETVKEDGGEVGRQILEHRGRKLVSETRRHAGGTTVRKLLTDEEELERYCSLPVLADRKRIHAALAEHFPRYELERAEFPAEHGAMMLDLGEPIGPLYGASKLEEYAVWSLTHDGIVRGFLDRVMEQKRIVYRWCLERDLADVYFLVGSELASPPLVSRATFQRWIVPYAKELIELIHCYGKKAIQHYHGQIREILEDFVEMAPDGLHTIEAPPTGNCTFTQAYEVTGDTVTLIGNIQYDCFRSYTPEQMAEAVRVVIAECRGKRFILSPTAGPYEPDIPPAMVENYLTFLKTGWEAG
jgi:uroporphyrinogen-III decarboxylase